MLQSFNIDLSMNNIADFSVLESVAALSSCNNLTISM